MCYFVLQGGLSENQTTQTSMKKLQSPSLWLVLPSILFSLVLQSQSARTTYLYLHGGVAVIQPDAKDKIPVWPLNQCFEGYCYAIVQFEQLPNLATRESWAARYGLQLHEFIPDKAYLASLPSEGELDDDLPLRAILPIEPHFKQSGAMLDQGGRRADGRYEVVVAPMPGIASAQAAAQLKKEGWSVSALEQHTLRLWTSDGELPVLLAHPVVKYIESAPAPAQPEGVEARASARIAGVNQGPGAGWDGEGVMVGIADDGGVNHIDFAGRVIDLTTDSGQGHAAMTAGMALGAGNGDPAAMGIAPAASLLLFDIGGYAHLNAANQWADEYGMVITSTSYAEGCGGYYSLSAKSLDDQVLNFPSLLHCFSAGNEGMEYCDNPYSGLENPGGFAWGNITGGRKAGKNQLTVGNVSLADELRQTSSRGPTVDGRIKPDICALGQGSLAPANFNTYQESSGTSAAAPVVAGAAALLYQAYRAGHDGQNPRSDLIKALMLNTAEDLGIPGPDYSYGWGRLHAARALEALQNGYYQIGAVDGQTPAFHQLIIPAGVHKVKVMLYWHDPGASPIAARSLVNDLDLRITSPQGQLFLPWSPSHAIAADSLMAPAIAHPDRVNNAEQIVMNQPASGYYSVRVNGFQIPQGLQAYVLVYSFEYDSLQLTHPATGASLHSGSPIQFRWDAQPKPEAAFSIAYSPDGMQTWQTVVAGISYHELGASWTSPAHTATHNAYFRIWRSDGQGDIVGPIVISAAIAVSASRYSDALARISWSAVPGAIAYEVFLQGERYPELAARVPADSLAWLMSAMFNQVYWVSVQPVFPDSLRGSRSVALRYFHEGCPLYVNLNLNLGDHPGWVSWRLLHVNGSLLATGGPYADMAPGSVINTSICVEAGCYALILSSTGAGGQANAAYALTQMTGQVLAAGSAVGPGSMHLLCVTAPGPPLALTALQWQNESCAGRRDGWINLTVTGGSTLLSYHWSHGAAGSQVSSLGAGIYSVTVTDGVQVLIHEITLTAPPPLTTAMTTTAAYCHNGSVLLLPSGGTAPYAVAWSDGNSAWMRTGLAAGGYAATLTDAIGCSASLMAFVPAGAPLTLTLQPNGTANALATAQGGKAPYTFQWANGALGAAAVSLLPGLHTCTVTDAGGCATTASITIAGPAYCAASGNSTAQEWIQKVKIGNSEWTTGNNGGYAAVSELPFSIQPGASHSVRLTPGFAQQSFAQRWRVYFDYNRDGDFMDAGEMAISGTASTGILNTQFTPSASLAAGYVRMRVLMRNGSSPAPCGAFARGEVEDYWVRIEPAGNRPTDLSANGVGEPPAASEGPAIYPNPTQGDALLTLPAHWHGTAAVSLYAIDGRRLLRLDIDPAAGPTPLDFSLYPAGFYWLYLEPTSTRKGEMLKVIKQ